MSWREFTGTRELIEEGDEEMHKDYESHWFPVDDDCINTMPKMWPNYRFRTKRPLPVKMEWRELGPDEERVQGEFSSQNPSMYEKCKVCGEEYGLHSGGKWDAFCRRTKRPLPDQFVDANKMIPQEWWNTQGLRHYVPGESFEDAMKWAYSQGQQSR